MSCVVLVASCPRRRQVLRRDESFVQRVPWRSLRCIIPRCCCCCCYVEWQFIAVGDEQSSGKRIWRLFSLIILLRYYRYYALTLLTYMGCTSAYRLPPSVRHHDEYNRLNDNVLLVPWFRLPTSDNDEVC